MYYGGVLGFRSWTGIRDDYSGPFSSLSFGVGPDIGLIGFTGGGTGFIGTDDPSIRGMSFSLGGSLGWTLPGVSFGIAPYLLYFPYGASKSYRMSNNKVDKLGLVFDLMRGNRSPWSLVSSRTNMATFAGIRSVAVSHALLQAYIYEDIRSAKCPSI